VLRVGKLWLEATEYAQHAQHGCRVCSMPCTAPLLTLCEPVVLPYCPSCSTWWRPALWVSVSWAHPTLRLWTSRSALWRWLSLDPSAPPTQVSLEVAGGTCYTVMANRSRNSESACTAASHATQSAVCCACGKTSLSMMSVTLFGCVHSQNNIGFMSGR
jgi:hypothetical protein